MTAWAEGEEDPPLPPKPKAGALARIGAFLLALILGFGSAVVVTAMVIISDRQLCEDVGLFTTEDECIDTSGAVKTAILALGWPGGVLAAIAAILACGLAFRGRGGRALAMVAIPAVVLSGISVIVTQVA